MNEEPRQYFCDPLLDDPKLYDLPQWRSQRGAGGRPPPAETLPPSRPPQIKLHFVQRSMESRHFESQSAPTPRSPLSTPCRPLILKSLATPLDLPPRLLMYKETSCNRMPPGALNFFFFFFFFCHGYVQA